MSKEDKQFQRTEDGHLILMTPEERKLLITDLTSRIEYGVICMIERVDDFGPRWRNEKLTGFCNEEGGYFYFDFCYGLTVDFAEKVKPYLRPISSMTEEEVKELENYIAAETISSQKGLFAVLKAQRHTTNFLYSRHLDILGLIEKGLALEAPEGMYEIKER